MRSNVSLFQCWALTSTKDARHPPPPPEISHDSRLFIFQLRKNHLKTSSWYQQDLPAFFFIALRSHTKASLFQPILSCLYQTKTGFQVRLLKCTCVLPMKPPFLCPSLNFWRFLSLEICIFAAVAPPTGSTGKVYNNHHPTRKNTCQKRMKISWIQNGNTMNHHESQLVGRKNSAWILPYQALRRTVNIFFKSHALQPSENRHPKQNQPKRGWTHHDLPVSIHSKIILPGICLYNFLALELWDISKNHRSFIPHPPSTNHQSQNQPRGHFVHFTCCFEVTSFQRL